MQLIILGYNVKDKHKNRNKHKIKTVNKNDNEMVRDQKQAAQILTFSMSGDQAGGQSSLSLSRREWKRYKGKRRGMD